MPVADVLLQSIKNVKLDLLPTGFLINSHGLGTEDWDQTVNILTEWIRDCVATLSFDTAFCNGRFDTDQLIRLVRSLWFIYSRDIKSSDGHTLYRHVLSALSYSAIYRYSRAILKPLIHSLGNELGKHREHFKEMLSDMDDVVTKWILICHEDMPILLQVRLTLVTSVFVL
jgi:hypothetical protein